MPMELERSIEISNKYGLHARASTRLAQVAKQFQSSISVSTPNAPQEVDAKSILGILTLGAEKGQLLRVKTCGEDAEAAMTAIVRLVEQNFGEE
jgi:phosphotransferase system HPr (HPr) family protein